MKKITTILYATDTKVLPLIITQSFTTLLPYYLGSGLLQMAVREITPLSRVC